jgi:hypothetical protein
MNLSYSDGHVFRIPWKAAKESRPFAFPGVPIEPGGDRDDYNRLLAGLPQLP